MDYRSSGEDDSDSSVVADSVESDRTPSPSILGGLEFLDRATKRSTPTGFNAEEQKKLCYQDTSDGEQKRKSPSGISSSKDVGSHPFPFFEPIHHGIYHHSPIFTPPRKLLTPSLIGCQDTLDERPPTASGLEMSLQEGPDEVYSQALFSSNQSSCQSPGLSFMTTGNLSSAGEEARDQLVALTDNIIRSLKETRDEDGRKTPSRDERDAQHSAALTQSVQGGTLSGESVKSTKILTVGPNENAVSSSISPGTWGDAGNVKSNDGTILPTASRFEKHGVEKLKEIVNTGQIQAKDVHNEIGKVLGSDSDATELTAAAPEDFPLVKQTASAGVQLVTVGPNPCPVELSKQKEKETSQEKQISLGNSSGNQSGSNIQPSDVQSCSSKSDESNSEFDHILKEYRAVEFALTQEDNIIISTLQEKLSRLKEEMKGKAHSLKEERRKILSHDGSLAASSSSTSANERTREEELLDLSVKQKQILSLLTIHKDLAALLSSKMRLEEDTSTGEKVEDGAIRPDEEGSSASPGFKDNITQCAGASVQSFIPDVADEQSTNVLSNDGSIDDAKMGNMEGFQPKVIKSLKVTTASPHLTLKDLLDEGVITPGKGCLAIPGKDEAREADLLPDGSILSGNVWYKTEREWYAQHSNQPATAVNRSELWNLITYNGDLLSNLACQCQVLSMAKAINPIQTDASVPKSAYPAAKIQRHPTAITDTKLVSQRRPFYDSMDLSFIKSIHLIGDEELFPEEEFFRDGFWRDDEVSGSVVPSSWLNDLTRWED